MVVKLIYISWNINRISSLYLLFKTLARFEVIVMYGNTLSLGYGEGKAIGDDAMLCINYGKSFTGLKGVGRDCAYNFCGLYNAFYMNVVP